LTDSEDVIVPDVGDRGGEGMKLWPSAQRLCKLSDRPWLFPGGYSRRQRTDSAARIVRKSERKIGMFLRTIEKSSIRRKIDMTPPVDPTLRPLSPAVTVHTPVSIA
jgi:hypothetical protein